MQHWAACFLYVLWILDMPEADCKMTKLYVVVTFFSVRLPGIKMTLYQCTANCTTAHYKLSHCVSYPTAPAVYAT